ncbi:hypothetical protein ABZV77_11435 [Streptomyces sp. NPDC004732]|uniref:hypothetical protein n=1 Tax=Streptomyces sp. NPDC004732 TaxID=3154290 RepID=UPI0033BBF776
MIEFNHHTPYGYSHYLSAGLYGQMIGLDVQGAHGAGTAVVLANISVREAKAIRKELKKVIKQAEGDK